MPNLPAHASTMMIGFLALANRSVISSTTYSVTSSEGAWLGWPLAEAGALGLTSLDEPTGWEAAKDSLGGAA